MSTSASHAVQDSLTNDDVPVRADEEKLAELLLLVAGELQDDRFGGAVKMNKVLFFAEFAHMRVAGRPITGAAYQKLKHGPAPRRLLPVRDRLVSSGAAEIVMESVLGRRQHRLRPRRAPRREMFSASELTAVADAVALLKGRTGTEASELSHLEPAWNLVDYREDIPFVAAYVAPDQERTSPAVRARAAEIAWRYASRSPG